ALASSASRARFHLLAVPPPLPRVAPPSTTIGFLACPAGQRAFICDQVLDDGIRDDLPGRRPGGNALHHRDRRRFHCCYNRLAPRGSSRRGGAFLLKGTRLLWRRAVSRATPARVRPAARWPYNVASATA